MRWSYLQSEVGGEGHRHPVMEKNQSARGEWEGWKISAQVLSFRTLAAMALIFKQKVTGRNLLPDDC
jgi:hypothetical protein